jgi:hypothetical protein
MSTTVRIKPEVITAHRLRIEMFGLEDEDIENTIRMKGWAWVLARRGWVYAGEPDFIYRQIREVIIAMPDISFEPDGIEESVRTVRMKNVMRDASSCARPSRRPASRGKPNVFFEL